jgi:outer membrane protein OmpA-like peptidoglycan-associated protein
VLADAGVASVAVRGHTDDRGSAAGNRRLSARRAEAVRQALIGAGVAESRIRVEGVGAAEPVASNSTASGRRQNRRIELRLQAGVGS